jgi:hypothetical protein
MTPSLNLYVSQQTTTGTLFVLAIIATIAVPALEYTAPLEKRACAPTSTMVTSGSSEGRAGSKAYVQGMGFGPRVNDFSNSLPRKRLSVAVDEQRQKKIQPSSKGFESTTTTENFLPSSCAESKTFSTADDRAYVRMTSPSLILLPANSWITLSAVVIRSRMYVSIQLLIVFLA